MKYIKYLYAYVYIKLYCLLHGYTVIDVFYSDYSGYIHIADRIGNTIDNSGIAYNVSYNKKYMLYAYYQLYRIIQLSY